MRLTSRRQVRNDARRGGLNVGDGSRGSGCGDARDGAAGRSLFGPHRTDLTAFHREKQRPAAEGSSGEQKALVLNLILAQIARLADQPAAPILLLDEAPAHLDERRRAALFDEIAALNLQAFMTGTERALFAGLDGRAQFVRVSGGTLEDG